MRRFAVIVGVAVTAACAAKVDQQWHAESGYRWRALDVRGGNAGFRLLAPSATGVTHANLVSDDSLLANRQLLIGAGAAAGDVDGDGLADLFVASVDRPGVLYRNVGGFRFEDVTAAAGLHLDSVRSTSAVLADVNGDAHLDLVVGTHGGPLKLWTGDGKGKFADATSLSGLPAGFAVTTMTLADVDGDGDLDLYAGTYKKRNALDAYTPQQRDFNQVVKRIGQKYEVLPAWTHEYRLEDHPELGGMMRSQRAEPDLFLENDGKGHFRRVALAGGQRFRDAAGKPLAEEPDYFTLASRFYDVNNDGAPDLYVCNDYEDPDQFWINDGHGGFRMADSLALRETSNTCMSVDFGDVNRDGNVDFFTADMMSPTLAQRQRQFPTHTPMPKQGGLSATRQQWMRNMLQLSRGDGSWASIGDFAGVSATDWTWGTAFLDVDLDGYEDILAFNGNRWDIRDADAAERIRNSFPRVPWNRESLEFPDLRTRSVALRNQHDLTFADQSRTWGIGTEPAITQGIALADFDNDGDLDVVGTRLNQPPAIYRNEASAPRVAVRLVGRAGNSQGIGARVTVRGSSIPAQTREVTSGGYYLSGSDAQLSFAAPDTQFTIEVRWRDGNVSRIESARGNRLYEIDESSAQRYPAALASAPAAPLFENASALLGNRAHTDSVFDDYRRQPLLPGRLSQLGPGVTWTDLDGDGRAELLVGAGKGSRITAFHAAGARFEASALGAPATGDLTTILPLAGAGRAPLILAGQSNYEAATPGEALNVPRVVSVTSRALDPVLAGDTATVGPMAAADVNGDGRLDLFVGARVSPGAWPLPAPSRLYLRNADGSWTPDAVNARVLAATGIVSAALFTDLDGDGRPELVVAAEWGPVRVFRNTNGRLADATAQMGLGGTTSRWNGLNAGDFDGDGRMDLVVTSWGRNSGWQATPRRPLALLVGRFADRPGVGLLFARRDSATGKEMPLESFARAALSVPSARDRIHTFAAYASADAPAVLGLANKGAVRVGATTFDHLVLLNRGGRFESRSLPALAQLAPAFAPVVADFNGDGREDLFLAQNFSATAIEVPRMDAGAGLVLIGDGDGSFEPMSIAQSGIRMLGDQRGAAVSDFDGDARVDLAVGQNGAAITLWRNRSATPGIRVRIEGVAENPGGIGTQLRIRRGSSAGPVREIHAGSGYWSVDDPVTVLALPADATELWVRLPGGAERTIRIQPAQREIRVPAN
jgi:enediyne biosynthesis protein E4